jgi:GTPase SAR1 family protein
MHFCPKVPVMLVGCKKDLRRDPHTIDALRKQNQRPIAPEQVSLLATHPPPLIPASTLSRLVTVLPEFSTC